MITTQLIPVNNCLGNSQTVLFATKIDDMDVKEIRRQRLKAIADNMYGSAGKFADALGIKRPQMSRWLTDNEKSRQGINEDSARRIEKELGLERGQLDLPFFDSATPPVAATRPQKAAEPTTDELIEQLRERLSKEHDRTIKNKIEQLDYAIWQTKYPDGKQANEKK